MNLNDLNKMTDHDLYVLYEELKKDRAVQRAVAFLRIERVLQIRADDEVYEAAMNDLSDGEIMDRIG